MTIFGNDSGLIGLGDVSEDDINHTDEEPVIKGFSSIMNNWDDVGSLFGHIDKISTDSVRELNGIDNSFRTNDIGNVRNSGS